MTSHRAILSALLFACIAALSPGEARADPPIVAVFDIVSKRARLNPTTLEGLSDYLSTLVAESSAYHIVPRSDIKRTLSTQKAESYKECYSTECQIEVGKELAATMSLLTQVTRIGKRCVVTLQLFDLRTAASTGASSARGECGEDQILESLERAVRKLAKPSQVAASSPKTPKPAVSAEAKPVTVRSTALFESALTPPAPSLYRSINSSKRVAARRTEAIQSLTRLYKVTSGRRHAELLFRLAKLNLEQSIAIKDERSKSLEAEAMRLFKKLTSEHPTYNRNDEALFHLGYNTYKTGPQKKAIAYYWTLIKQFPKSPILSEAYLLLGAHFFDQRRVSYAVKSLERSIASKPSSHPNYALYLLALCDYSNQEFARGAAKLTEVANRTRNLNDAYSRRLHARALKDLSRYSANELIDQ